jgi:geranylgeranyl pyrophosphate synthase
MNVVDKLDEKKAAVEADLRRLLSGGYGLFEAMRYAVLGSGKRFRPLLLLSAGESCGAGRPLLLPYACAVELIHSYSLVHDDLPSMDNDDVRRGQPACHKAFGDGPALLAGDGLLSLAFEVLSRAPHEAGRFERKERAVEEIAAAAGVEGMIRGQWMDITLEPGSVGADAYDDLIRRKTGALIRASVVAGAILAGAPGAVLAALTDYGEAVGRAFQLRDDLLDAGAAGRDDGPKAAAVLGLGEARAGLEASVDGALKSLEAGQVDSEELRHLAASLRLERDP